MSATAVSGWSTCRVSQLTASPPLTLEQQREIWKQAAEQRRRAVAAKVEACQRKTARRRNPLVLEGELGLVNDDHYVCRGDIYIDETALVTAILARWLPLITHEHMGAIGQIQSVGRYRITVERL